MVDSGGATCRKIIMDADRLCLPPNMIVVADRVPGGFVVVQVPHPDYGPEECGYIRVWTTEDCNRIDWDYGPCWVDLRKEIAGGLGGR